MDGHVWTIISAAGAGLAAAILTLWKNISKRADTLERQHEEAQSKLLAMNGEIGELKGKISLAQEVKPHLDRIETTAEEMLTHIRELRNEGE